MAVNVSGSHTEFSRNRLLYAFCMVLDAVRQTRLGALGLGSAFHWPDFVAYTVGIGVGAGAEWGLPRIIRLLCPHS